MYECFKNNHVFMGFSSLNKESPIMKTEVSYVKAGSLTLPETGRTVVTTRNGKVIYRKILSKKHHVATLREFFEIAQRAGFTVAAVPLRE